MAMMMAYQEDGPGALLENTNISFEQTKSQKVYVINIIFF